MRVHRGVSPVAEQMLAYRTIHGLTQTQAAVRLGVRQPHWARWETGARWPDPAWRQRILALCNGALPASPFAAACKAFREREAVTQAEAAELLGVNVRTWERWEGGQMVPAKHSRKFWRLLGKSRLALEEMRRERRKAA